MNKIIKAQREKYIADNFCIFRVLTGSRLYGTFVEESDYDYKGIAIPPKSCYMGFEKFEQCTYSDDDVIYDFRKAVYLMYENNPNMLDMLFAPRSFHITNSKFWDTIYDNRYMFLSKRIKQSYSGYANQQLHRMKNHKKWIMEPPVKPERKDFGVDEIIISRDHLRTLLSLPEKYVREDLKGLCRKEKIYQKAKSDYKSYNNHMKKRNPARLKIEMEIGYDTKHAMHLIRLLRQCKEIFETNDVTVNRTDIDADILIDIRNGKRTYEEIIAEAETLEKEINVLYEKSTLPEEPDIDVIEKLVISTLEDYWYETV